MVYQKHEKGNDEMKLGRNIFIITMGILTWIGSTAWILSNNPLMGITTAIIGIWWVRRY